jgi:small conductance mechanosensitive channel
MMGAVVVVVAAATPTPTLTSVLTVQAKCYEDSTSGRTTLCRLVYDWTGNGKLAEFSDWLIAKPATILLILVVAVLARWLLHRLINRLTVTAGETGSLLATARRYGRRSVTAAAVAAAAERRLQRTATMASILRSIATAVIVTIAGLEILAELTVNIAPLIAGAGILGVALAFGAQALVKDFLSGIFLIAEDQYGMGDDVDLGDVGGTVEAVGLRVTRIRDPNGMVWYVRNGEILRVGNRSQGWGVATVDIEVLPDEDVASVRELLEPTARDGVAAEGWLLDEPSVVVDAAAVRVTARTVQGRQWEVAGRLRDQIRAALDAAGLSGDRRIHAHAEGSGAEEGAPEPDRQR